jgi:hypothetical protein
MKILPMGTVLTHAHKRTEWQRDMKLIADFRDYGKYIFHIITSKQRLDVTSATKKPRVYCDVGTECLCVIYVKFLLQKFKNSYLTPSHTLT